jgi:ABC-type cobalamin/Fe3+-siderophores transport system ATPase subunit
VLLLDEPTASLDPRSETMILELPTSFGSDKTIVTATHDLKLAADLANYCFLLSEAKVVASGEPAASSPTRTFSTT